MTYDSSHGQVVMFGGLDSFNIDPDGLLNDTWVWDGAKWTQESLQNGPPARFGHAVAYDSVRGQVVLFGGRGESQSSPLLNDTWVWDGSNWTQKFPQTSPPPRYGHALAYDSAHSQTVLFGGSDGSSSPLGDTWMWDGTNWTQESPKASPPGRSSFALAYDTGHSDVVLFGGDCCQGTLLNDTWVWDGSNWTQELPTNSPPARYQQVMAYDSGLGQMVMFGGEGLGIQCLDDTWVWDGTNWTQQSPQNIPPLRLGDAIAYDSGHGQAVLFGGQPCWSDNFLSDTWTYGVGPPPIIPSVSGVISASAFGGFTSVAPGTWVEIYGTNLAPHTRGWTSADFIGGVGAPTSLDGVSVIFGGQPAFVDYISPTQVNAQLPNANLPISPTFQLTLTYATANSAPINLSVNATEPGLLAPASFNVGGHQYVVAQFPDGTYVLPTGAIAGINSRPAKPGETIIIYGIGFGLVSGNIFAGQIVMQENQLLAPFEMMFANTPAQLPYFGLAPNLVGVYQFNVTVPAVPDNDLVPLTFKLGGVPGAQTLFTAVHE